MRTVVLSLGSKLSLRTGNTSAVYQQQYKKASQDHSVHKMAGFIPKAGILTPFISISKNTWANIAIWKTSLGQSRRWMALGHKQQNIGGMVRPRRGSNQHSLYSPTLRLLCCIRLTVNRCIGRKRLMTAQTLCAHLHISWLIYSSAVQ